MEALITLLQGGMFSLLDIVLVGIIGLILYFMRHHVSNNQKDVQDTINGLQILLNEERIQTQALSNVVYEMKKDAELEKDKNYALREEILELKAENRRLQTLVTQMDNLIKQYQHEIEVLKEERKALMNQ